MAAPTAQELLERLRQIYEAEEGAPLSDERLAARLPISLATFNRWKKHDTRAYREIVGLLELAGWLTPTEARQPIAGRVPSPADLLAETRSMIGLLIANQEAVLDALGVPEAERVRPALEPTTPESPPVSGSHASSEVTG